MSLTKTSDRTVRKGCKYCGRTDLYWARDDSTGQFVLVEATPAARAASKGDGLADAMVHACRDLPSHPADDDTAPESNEYTPVPAAETEPEPVVTVPATASTDAVTAAVQTILAAASGPKIDTDQIREIVRAELGEIVFPTRTVVVRESDGSRREIEGHTHECLADVSTALLAGEHVLMVGPAGTGKSTIAEQAAEALGVPAYSISLSPQTPTSALFGYMQATGDYVPTLYRQAYETGGVFCFDELDNGHPAVLAAVNASLANGHCAFPDGMVKRHDDFRCVGTANTYGTGPDRKYVGRQQLDAATLDRFTVITVPVDESLESQLCHDSGLESDKVAQVLAYVRHLRRQAETHKLQVVISPRCSMGLCKLLHAGLSWDKALEARARKGMPTDQWSKISAGAPVVAL